jgi:hypothetical protein
MTKIIVAKTKHECDHLLGQFPDESHYDVLIEEDTDCYLPFNCGMETKAECSIANCADCPDAKTKDEIRIAFKFRKNYFSKEEQEQAYLGLRNAAVPSQNRGQAAGPRGDKLQNRDWVTAEQIKILEFLSKLDSNSLFKLTEADIQLQRDKAKRKPENRGFVWLSSETEKHQFNFDTWLSEVLDKSASDIKNEAKWIQDTFISDTTYANQVNSGIAGWFDRYPRIPYGRATSYTQNHFDKFEMAFPFLQSLNRGFKQLLPWRWANQKRAADQIDQKFLVPDTVFSTITVNKTFRTACHRDAGDFTEGLSNLLVLSNNGNYSGAYLVFPEVRIAVNVRPGDLLLVNNHEIIHGNTPIVLHDEGAERISLVCYLREKMLKLGSYEYENLRYEFVESRRKNQEHPEWRKFWNGISEDMWDSDEWYQYLLTNGGQEMLDKYHPKTSSLESLFG